MNACHRLVIGLAVIAVAAGLTGSAGAHTLTEAFDRVHRSVVVIRTVQRQAPAETGQTLVSVRGQGSGVLISPEGEVLTAAHIVDLASEITVEFWDGRRVGARVVASEPEADVSLLRLLDVPRDAAVARLGDSDRVRIGEPVFVIGAPYGISHTLTAGHVSGRHRPGRIWDRFELAEFLQTDAAINRGNSGGPMFSMAGEVIGIVSHIISKSGGAEGLGFVVTANAARRLLIERRSPWWGFSGEVIDGDLMRVFNLPEPGLLIERVVQDSPAARLGLRGGFLRVTLGDRALTVGGDVLLRVDDMPCGDAQRVREHLARLKPGDRLTVTVFRGGRRQELEMVVPAR